MEGALIVLIPVSVLIVAAVVGILWWAARHGQFDDMEGPAHAILMDDDKDAGFPFWRRWPASNWPNSPPT